MWRAISVEVRVVLRFGERWRYALRRFGKLLSCRKLFVRVVSIVATRASNYVVKPTAGRGFDVY